MKKDIRGIEHRKVSKEAMLKLPIQAKIEHAKTRIREFQDAQDGNTYIAFSGGKDSVVLRHLVHSLYPDTPVVFSNTTNEYSEILEFIRKDASVIWLQPEMTFIDIMKTEGFPLVSKKVSRGMKALRNPTDKNEGHRNLLLNGITKDGHVAKSYMIAKKWQHLTNAEFDMTDKCCDILKKRPLHKYQKETGRAPFIGTQASESKTRERNWVDYGCNIIGDTDDKSRPLSIWNEDDIWEYIEMYTLDYSTIYDDVLDNLGNLVVRGETRTGCAYCGYGANLECGDTNRFQRLSIRKPKQYEKMMGLENNGVTYEEALNIVEVATRNN